MNQTNKIRISYSKCNTFLTCRKKYWWNYVEDLTPRIKARPLMVGSIVHQLREQWVKGELTAETFAELIEQVNKQFPGNDPDECQSVAHEAAVLINGYIQQYQDDDFVLSSPEMHVEKEFEDFKLYSRLDGLVTDPNGNTWRDELKTAGRMDSRYLQGYRKGLQTAIAHWVMDETFDFKTRGTLFEIIVKTKIPQYQRVPVIFEKWRVEYAKEVVYGIVDSIKRGNFYPSLACDQFGRNCEYEPLCSNDTPNRRATFYTSYEGSRTN